MSRLWRAVCAVLGHDLEPVVTYNVGAVWAAERCRRGRCEFETIGELLEDDRPSPLVARGAGRGRVWRGRAGLSEAWRGGAGCGAAWRGAARLDRSWQGTAGYGEPRHA